MEGRNPLLLPMNKYLEKVAELLSEENKQVGKTFLAHGVASLPAEAAGGYLGHLVGKRYGKGVLGTFAGTQVAGAVAGLAAIKASLHGKVKENE